MISSSSSSSSSSTSSSSYSSSSTSSSTYIENWSSSSSSYIENWSSSSVSNSSSTSSSGFENWSSSSSSSTSSFSSSSVTSGSISSSSSSSLSSLSSASTSSSSYVERWSSSSSSESSESEGNVSTSSSSSFEGKWNRTKPLILGLSSVTSSLILNRLAQTITLTGSTYEIGKVYCYFYGPYGINNNFTLTMGIYECTEDGRPETLLHQQTLSGASITESGWYYFDFSAFYPIPTPCPSNKLLSFVIYQTGGDENNYALWGYSEGDTSGSPAWFSDDAIEWIEQKDILRALKVTAYFDIYDLTDYRVLSPSAEERTFVGSLEWGTQDRTQYNSNTGTLTLDPPNVLTSFVMDSSGSMGWNDRLSTRQEVVSGLIQKMSNNYASSYLFDIVKFGAQIANVNSIFSSLGMVATINLDLSTPDRTSYLFTTNINPNAVRGDVYTSNGASYTVLANNVNGTTLVCMGDASITPDTSGVLTISSGTGSNVSYQTYITTTVDTPVIAYGFKNFTEDHVYNIAEVNLGTSVPLDVSLTNWQTLIPGPDDVTLGIGSNGPRDGASLDLKATEALYIRRSVSSKPLNNTKLTANVALGDTTVYVENSSDFGVGNTIDLLDRYYISMNHTITAINGNVLTIFPTVRYNIGSWDTNGGRMQISGASYFTSIDTNMAKILVRDIDVDKSTNDTTFYIQSSNGFNMEWDFEAYSKWYVLNLYRIDDSATLPVSLFDEDGNPFPDNTEISFYVNELPEEATGEDLVNAALLTVDAPYPTYKLYVNSTSGFKRNDPIDIVDNNGQLQRTKIDSIDEDSGGEYITITPDPTQYSFLVVDGARITISTSVEDISNASSQISQATLLSTCLSVVDVTPIFQGVNLSTTLLKPYDDPVPFNTSLSDLNTNLRYIRNKVIDVPTINSHATIRILPITEDNLKTLNEKNSEASRLLRPEVSRTLADQLEQDSGDIQSVESSILQTTTATTTLLIAEGQDYTIDSPVYLRDGYAESTITTFATELEEVFFEGIRVPGISNDIAGNLLVKEYQIYPVITLKDSNQAIIAQQFLEYFLIYFTPPVTIYSTYSGGQISYNTLIEDADCPATFKGYEQKSINGVYASSDNKITINYVVTELVDNVLNMYDGDMTIKIYSNTVIDMQDITEIEDDNFTKQDLNVVLPQTSSNVDGQIQTVQPLTAISSWIDDVENNAASQIIEETATDVTEDSQAYRNMVLGLDSQNTQEDIEEDEPAFEWYTKPWEWTKATQYGIYQEQTISVVNGKATLTIDATDVSALLMIQASISYGNNDKYTTLRSDLVTVGNPIDIGAISPSHIRALGGSDKYTIGTNVFWMTNTISDNVEVIFNFPKTQALPSDSKTSNGWAGSVRLGPHAIVIMNCPDPSQSDCPCTGEIEKATVTVSYLGYTRTTERIIEWIGDEPEDEMANTFYFFVNDNQDENLYLWADGNSASQSILTSDLNDDLQDLIWFMAPGEDGIVRLQGYDQDTTLPNQYGTARPVYYYFPQYTTGESLQRIWTGGRARAIVYGMNKNIGYEQPQSSETNEENTPWTNDISVRTSYYFTKSDGTRKYLAGHGSTIEPYVDPESGSIVYAKPRVRFKEPLGIALSIEESFIRDGVHTANVVADVTWQDAPLYGIDYAFPDVTFEAGICEEKNENEQNDGTIWMLDTRNALSNCVTIGDHPDISLTSYSSAVSLNRTSIYDDGINTHTHDNIYYSSGDGITNVTINLTGTTASHQHDISDYTVSNVSGHVHTLRSVAITQINPTVNTSVNIAINGYVVYDPTNCLAYTPQDTQPQKPKPNTFEKGNRMMYDTLYLDTSVKDKELLLTMTAQNGYTCKNVTETNKAIDIDVRVRISAYSVEISPGQWIVIPESDVPDGTRVIFDIESFKAMSAEAAETSNNVLVIRPDKVRKYMYIRANATSYLDELSNNAAGVITISSSLQWLPGTIGLLAEPTNDNIYLNGALDKIITIGSSQINDAVKLAADRIIQYQNDQYQNNSSSTWKDAKKIIFLMTDGDENTSEFSIEQAINEVNIINGKCENPIIPVRFGFAYGSDDVLLTKYANDTCGSKHYLINANVAAGDITSAINDIVTDSVIKINDGIYTNTIDLESENLPKRIYLSNFVLPGDSRLLFRTRYSSDNSTWSDWSEWLNSSAVDNFVMDLQFKGRYFQYQMHLFGSSDFESPVISSGATLDYYKSQSLTIFFQPIELDINTDEYMASIHITHKADIPGTSTVNYGCSQFNSTDIMDYYGTTLPMITPDRHTILLTRYNELFLTSDYKKYTAINGRWPDGAEIDVYRINSSYSNGQLVNSTDYAVNNKEGIITFYNIQDKNDTFVLCIKLDSVFRIICNIINYGTKSVIIDHIGLMYNTTKRIPTDNNGNIIHTPIKTRI